MTFAIHVKGGTGAGRRVIRQTYSPTWEHHCDADLALTSSGERITGTVTVRLSSTRKRCPVCGARRPA